MTYLVKVTYFCEHVETGKLKSIKKNYILSQMSNSKLNDLMSVISELQNNVEELKDFFDALSDSTFDDYSIVDASIDMIKMEDNAELIDTKADFIYKVVLAVNDVQPNGKLKVMKYIYYITGNKFEDAVNYKYLPGGRSYDEIISITKTSINNAFIK